MKRTPPRPDAGQRPRTAPIAAVIVATSALGLLAAACGGRPTSGGAPNAAGSSTARSDTAFSACMRSRGVPGYPDPAGNGQLPKTDAQRLGVSSAQYRAAQQACQHLLVQSGAFQQQEALCMQNSDCSAAMVQQMMNGDLKLARCMRSHGVPNFPDPASGGPGGPFFPISHAGISEAASRTPQFVAELDECARLVGDNAPEQFG